MANQTAIAQLLEDNTLELMTRESAGAILGDGTVTTLTRPRGPLNVDAFGIKWTHLAVPPQLGRRDWAVTIYEGPTVQISVIRTLLDGTDVLGQLVESSTNEQTLFKALFPTRIDVWVLPGVFMAFDWLLFL
jgi:hypothetical protein